MENIVKKEFRLDQGIELIFDFDQNERNFDLNEAAEAIISFVKSKRVNVISVEKYFDPNYKFSEDKISHFQINVDAAYFPAEDTDEIEFSSVSIFIYAPHFGDCDSVAHYELQYSEKISAEMVISSFKKMFLLLEMELY